MKWINKASMGCRPKRTPDCNQFTCLLVGPIGLLRHFCRKYS